MIPTHVQRKQSSPKHPPIGQMTYNAIIYSVYITSVIAIALNMLLFFVVQRFASKMGAFKYILMFFALLETTYSIAVLLTLPVFYVYNHRLIVFSHDGLISHTPFATYAVGLFCTFSEMWIGMVVIMFIYRYLALCRDDLWLKMSHNMPAKIAVFTVYLLHVIYSILCGVYWCTQNRVPLEIMEKLKEEFHLNQSETMGYWVASLKSENDEFTIAGLFSVANHFALSVFSTILITFCGFSIWKKISEMSERTSEYKKNKQVFTALSIQAVIPLLMHQLPTAIILTYALLTSSALASSIVPAMSLLATIPKILNPISILFVIEEFRRAIYRLFVEGRIYPSSAALSPNQNSNSRF